MDLYESLEKQERQLMAGKIDLFTKKAMEYAGQGFDEKSVAELIQVDGCEIDLSKKIANSIVEKYPIMYCMDNPPKSFFDIKDNVKQSIKTSSIEKIEVYFKKFAETKHDKIVQKIMEARELDSDQIYDAIVDEIEPSISGIIAMNNALAKDASFEPELEEREIYEQELFGIWPVRYVRKKAEIDGADEKLLKKVKIKEMKHISFI